VPLGGIPLGDDDVDVVLPVRSHDESTPAWRVDGISRLLYVLDEDLVLM
jgi:hypothetical protein